MSGVRGATWEVGEESGCLDPGASSTALTSTLQRCTLHDIKVKLDSDPSRPLSLSSPPPDLRHKINIALHRRLSAADGPDACNASASENCIPSWSTTPPTRLKTVSNERRRRLRPCTTWHPSTGHWTWTSPALRTLRCAAFAEKDGRGSKRVRLVTTDATLELNKCHARIDRLRRRIMRLEDRRENGSVSDATLSGSEASQETIMSDHPSPKTITSLRGPPWDKSSL